MRHRSAYSRCLYALLGSDYLQLLSGAALGQESLDALRDMAAEVIRTVTHRGSLDTLVPNVAGTAPRLQGDAQPACAALLVLRSVAQCMRKISQVRAALAACRKGPPHAVLHLPRVHRRCE